ncbi:15019_t:CDS:1, partial [Entrophospora sp. SA101]
LQYTFESFENDYIFTSSKEIKHYDHMFNNFKDELGVSEKISKPSLLGSDNIEILPIY